MIRVLLPLPLQVLAQTGREILLPLEGAATLEEVLDSVEASYPSLRGTLRDQVTHQRRAFIRFFALGEDLSLEPPGSLLPEEVQSGAAPLRIIGAMAGG